MFESDLRKTVANIEWMIPERKDIHVLVRKAWEELQPQFRTAAEEIREIVSTDVSERARFQAMGLSGSQLELKIREYTRRRERLLDFDKLKLSRIASDVLKRLLKALLTSADNILDTLASMFPPMQAIKEFKDTLVSIASD
jgi:hypothetical protein